MTDNLFAITQALGGLGLFLLGMIIMTDGLREMAGDSIRSALMRFTASPASGALTGAISTAILQSSSATTVAAVGFVGAGLMTFTSSLGVIFGANIGTTITGWLVALVGFKLKLGVIMTPVILTGAILRLFAKGVLKSVGYAVAGFGLIMFAIGVMQTSMLGMQGMITPEMLPPDTFFGRLQIVALGVITTIITQSSSAGVAATMTALYAGAISFEQGLALVIGMDIGTTVTALLATIGGTTGAKRTGLSHFVYNVFTGMAALALITPYIALWTFWSPEGLLSNAEVALVAFHTLFNMLGLAVMLPFTYPFARLIKALLPDHSSIYATGYDDALLLTPGIALAAVQQSVQNYYSALLKHVESILGAEDDDKQVDLALIGNALDETSQYLDKIELQGASDANWEHMLALVHAFDHLQRLHERCEEDEERAITAAEAVELLSIRQDLIAEIQDTLRKIIAADWVQISAQSKRWESVIAQDIGPMRDGIASSVADGSLDIPDATDRLQAIRWLERVSYHINRINLHLKRAALASGK